MNRRHIRYRHRRRATTVRRLVNNESFHPRSLPLSTACSCTIHHMCRRRNDSTDYMTTSYVQHNKRKVEALNLDHAGCSRVEEHKTHARHFTPNAYLELMQGKTNYCILVPCRRASYINSYCIHNQVSQTTASLSVQSIGSKLHATTCYCMSSC